MSPGTGAAGHQRDGTPAVASTGGDRPADRTYYGRPVVKAPEWTWEVPWYLFAGGLAGASSMLSVGAALTGNVELARRTRLIAAAGAAVSPPLLISDLGRPARFLNMLRVFKPTSVMSVGSWTLASYSAAAAGSVGLDVLGRLPRLRGVVDTAAGVLGLGMTTYTGALLADTSIPVWHGARRHLPALFASSSLASAGAAAVLVTTPANAAPARRAAVTGAVAEVVIDALMVRHLGPAGEVYDHGRAGRFHRAATSSTTVGAALIGLGRGRRRVPTMLGAAALLAGSVCLRWSAYHAGFSSARDPLAVTRPQRARLDRGEGYRHPVDPVRPEP